MQCVQQQIDCSRCCLGQGTPDGGENEYHPDYADRGQNAGQDEGLSKVTMILAKIAPSINRKLYRAYDSENHPWQDMQNR